MKEFLNDIKQERNLSATVRGLRGSTKALFAARLANSQKQPVIIITASEEQAAVIEQDLSLFTTLPVLLYPAFDIPPYTPLSPDPSTVAARISTLYRLLNSSGSSIMVIPAEALLRRIIPRKKLSDLAELVIKGEEVDQSELVRRLIASGYEQVSMVQNPGDLSLRGGILDVFPPRSGESLPQPGSSALISENCPVRMDFFGDFVESIRYFDPISQRSLQELEELTLLPVSDILYPDPARDTGSSPSEKLREYSQRYGWDPDEADFLVDRLNAEHRFPGIEFLIPVFHDQLAGPLDYVPDNSLVLLTDPLEITNSIELTWERINANHLESLEAKKPALSPNELFLPRHELTEKLDDFSVICLDDLSLTVTDDDQSSPLAAKAAGKTYNIATGNHTLLSQELELQRRQKGLLAPLAKQIAKWQAEGDKTIIACRTNRHAEQLIEFLSHHGIIVVNRDLPADGPAIDSNEISLYISPLSSGFDLPDEKLHFLSEAELFGEKRISRRQASCPADDGEPVTFEELKAGEIVVHRQHGLGSYAGLVNMTLNGIEGDFLQIEYLDDDKLYVPVDRLNSVHKYKGLSDQEPRLDKLGGKAWLTAKEKVKEAVWKVAQELLDLYAKRQISTGHRFSLPDAMFHELEESFPCDETPGQLKAINEVIDDLTSEKVMDRLVCGDVGYGKTEVAVRAAFKVLTDGSQIAVLVPTTVLAEQHAATFRERLKGFAVRVEALNRFRPKTEQRETLSGLKDGSVDIVIGTQRLLSKDIEFRKLGLLIIDEEHRFGVKHKEKIKKIRAGVDVLTLTATPIPRTLQLSLLGIRDLSVISSPPRHRRSVKTFVAKFDDLVIKEAITREMQRGGQVFVVHNRIQSIQQMARRIHDLKPEVRIADRCPDLYNDHRVRS
jgi:transcription-repair coupling factor (superfamily II helicase)